jgi:hypothetical protein
MASVKPDPPAVPATLRMVFAALALAACSLPPSEPAKPPTVAIPPPPPPPTASADASVAPAPPSPESAWDAEVARLRPLSVCVRFPDIVTCSPESAEPAIPLLAQVLAAALRATADMFVHLAKGNSAGPVRPWLLTDAGHFNVLNEDPQPPTAAPLAKYATALLGWGWREEDSIILTVNLNAELPPPIPDRMPGLVWELPEGGGAYFVSLDGGMYGVDSSSIELGAGPTASWPSPVPDPAFGTVAIDQRSYGTAASFDQAQKDFLGCVKRTWGPVEKKLDAKSYAKGSELAAMVAKEMDYFAIAGFFVRRACKKKIDAWETAFAGLIEERKQARIAVFEKAKARVVALGADK